MDGFISAGRPPRYFHYIRLLLVWEEIQRRTGKSHWLSTVFIIQYESYWTYFRFDWEKIWEVLILLASQQKKNSGWWESKTVLVEKMLKIGGFQRFILQSYRNRTDFFGIILCDIADIVRIKVWFPRWLLKSSTKLKIYRRCYPYSSSSIKRTENFL